ncbi:MULTISPECIES: hypothetical protein [Streptococcus]|uniref:hypothetical protein n=1 Tax=Streptococcus TaxID=1301 RepID=UPI0002991109|nr:MULTISPECIES: hypothetical protein [Streptococcus]EKS16767.1 hypothetical protein HMPREF9188_01386 [Streptococcus sp. F0441]ORO43848.1 hypothetical protein B7726_02870 [Streptococcus oralis subsp. tigurinus]
MKNWSQFKNWLMALLACEAILLVLCFLYARAIILEQILFLALALFAVLVLSDLLLTWTLILTFGLGLIVLVAGVVYIPIIQLVFLLISFPLLIGILLKVRYYFFKVSSKVQEQEDEARADYQAMVTEQSDVTVQSLLIHWAHEDLFFQIKPKEHNLMLSRIQEVISQELSYNDKLYYVSNGNFLVLSNSSQDSLKQLYLNGLQEKLGSLVFHGEDGNQGIQFQTGYLMINYDNKDKYQDYSDIASHLKRQLETDVIVEY